MSEKRRALGRGLGALIPSAPPPGSARPTDVFFKENRSEGEENDTERFTGNHDETHGEQGPAAGPEAGDRFTGNEHHVPSTHGTADESGSGAATAEGTDGAGTAQGDHLAPVPGARFAEVPVDRIRPNPRQPREVFDEDDLAELTHSVREIGVLQPVVVRSIDEGTGEAGEIGGAQAEDATAVRYELIMGERRWRACRAAGLTTIPAIIKDTRDDDLLRDALLENLHRSQLNALEEAAAYQQLLDDFGCTHDELAARIGRSRPQISNTLRLLKLPPLVARRVAAGVLSAGHARALLALPDGAAMERLAQRIVAEGLSVRTVEEIVALGGEADAPTKRRSPRAGNRHPQLDDLAAALSDRFDTRVNIALGKRKGKLTVEFASVDDLNRIVALLDPGDDLSVPDLSAQQG